jgi:NADPH:quinone reductase-like Zn-dependent oxidoreductase
LPGILFYTLLIPIYNMPSNKAAYQPQKKAPKLEVTDAPYPTAADDQIVVRVGAVAINPIDWLIQSRGDLMFTHLKYPFVLGWDAAGEVVQVGKSVSRFRPGDRVVGLTSGADQPVNDSAQGAFQNYTVMRADHVSHIPASMTVEQAAVIPLGLTTAATALFDKSGLGLQLPCEPARPSTGQTVIVWGGSTSVGCCAIQLAVAAGYEVLTTASPKNFDLVRKLGASQVWDYRSPSIVHDITSYLEGKTVVGALAIGDGSAELCMNILDKSRGIKAVALVTFPLTEEPKHFAVLRTMVSFFMFLISYKIKGAIKGVASSMVNISTILGNDTGKYIYSEYLPNALEAGTFLGSPEPEIVGQGLESIQLAFDLQRKGVSAKKVVVTV